MIAWISSEEEAILDKWEYRPQFNQIYQCDLQLHGSIPPNIQPVKEYLLEFQQVPYLHLVVHLQAQFSKYNADKERKNDNLKMIFSEHLTLM